MIDWSQVADLYADFGEDGFGEVVQVFVQEVETGLAQLNAAQSPDENRIAFHFLKGAALNLGFSEVADLCAAGELRASEGKDAAREKEQVLRVFPPTCILFEQQWRQRLAPKH